MNRSALLLIVVLSVRFGPAEALFFGNIFAFLKRFLCFLPIINRLSCCDTPQNQVTGFGVEDRRIVSASDERNKTTFYGLKDESGAPITLDSFVVGPVNTDGTDPVTTFTFDEAGRFTEIFGEDGSHFSFDWSSFPVVEITYIHNGEEIIGNATLDENLFNVTNRRLIDHAGAHPTHRSLYSSSFTVAVTDCEGSPVENAMLSVYTTIADAEGNTLSGSTRGDHTGNGQYSVSSMIDQGPVIDLPDLKEVCETIADVIGNVCTAFDFLNQGANGQIICLYIGIFGTPAAFAACETVFISATLACQLIGPAPGTSTIKEFICDNIETEPEPADGAFLGVESVTHVVSASVPGYMSEHKEFIEDIIPPSGSDLPGVFPADPFSFETSFISNPPSCEVRFADVSLCLTGAALLGLSFAPLCADCVDDVFRNTDCDILKGAACFAIDNCPCGEPILCDGFAELYIKCQAEQVCGCLSC